MLMLFYFVNLNLLKGNAVDHAQLVQGLHRRQGETRDREQNKTQLLFLGKVNLE